MSLPERIVSKIERTDTGCWAWTAATNGKGYGLISIDGSAKLAHRVVYMELAGPIPDGMTIDHVCRNKRCVNPAHLDVVTVAENNRRAAETITTCRQGHRLEGDNLRIKQRSQGAQRVCVACAREASRRCRERAKGAPLAKTKPRLPQPRAA